MPRGGFVDEQQKKREATRARNAMVRQQKEYAQRAKATIMLQSAARGFLARLYAKDLMRDATHEEILERRKGVHFANSRASREPGFTVSMLPSSTANAERQKILAARQRRIESEKASATAETTWSLMAAERRRKVIEEEIAASAEEVRISKLKSLSRTTPPASGRSSGAATPITAVRLDAHQRTAYSESFLRTLYAPANTQRAASLSRRVRRASKEAFKEAKSNLEEVARQLRRLSAEYRDLLTA